MYYDDIAIVAAMEREISFLRSAMVPQSTRDDRFAVGTIGSKTVMLVRTGVGPDKTAQRLSEFTCMRSPQCVLSIGCAGGLRPHIKTGDVILSEKVIDNAVDGYELLTSQELVQAAKDCCRRLELPFHSGNTVSTSVVVATPEDKNNLAEKHAALSVDMETAQVAAWADGLGIPLLAVRTVLDAVDDRIPREIALITGKSGTVRPLKAFPLFVRRPALVTELVRLKRKLDRSMGVLERFVLSLLRTI